MKAQYTLKVVIYADVFRKNRMGIRYEFAGCFYAYSLTSVNFPHAKITF